MAGAQVSISAADGGAFDSYVVSPAVGEGTGVVIVSTISGVDSDMTHYADTLAAEGFVVSAPDMFWRDDDPGPDPRSEKIAGSARCPSLRDGSRHAIHERIFQHRNQSASVRGERKGRQNRIP